MRYSFVFILAGLIFAMLPEQSAEAATITYDWTTEPEASNFDEQASASTTVDGVTLSASLFGGTAFNTTAGGLGARGVGSGDNFDGEGGFTFNFDSPGTLTSITLISFGTSYNLVSPNDGTQNYTANFTGENYTFLAGENFTFQHVGGAYRVASIVIEVETEAVPEPSTAVLAVLGMLVVGICWTCKRFRRAR